MVRDEMDEMSRTEQDALAAWLESEENGRLDADHRFTALFQRTVPRLAPSLGFVERTLAGWRREAEREWSPVSRWVWAATAAVLVLAGVALAAWNPVATVSLASAAIRGAVAVFEWSRAALTAWVHAGTVAWQVSAAVGRAVLLATATGGVPWVLAAHLAVAVVSCCALKHLLADVREEYSR